MDYIACSPAAVVTSTSGQAASSPHFLGNGREIQAPGVRERWRRWYGGHIPVEYVATGPTSGLDPADPLCSQLPFGLRDSLLCMRDSFPLPSV